MKADPASTCTWCAAPAVEAQGVYLKLISRGRFICSACGRFTIHCECPITNKVVLASIQARASARY